MSRRRSLVAALTATLVLNASSIRVNEAAAQAPLVPEQARTAQSFVDSVGVNTHFHYTDTTYRDFGRTLKSLQWLGVKHIRESVFANPAPDSRQFNEQQFARLNEVARLGIRGTLLMGRPGGNSGTLAQLLSAVATRVPHAVEALEGPNEYDLAGDPAWAASLRGYQQELHRQAKADARLRHLPVLGPSLVRRESHDQLGDVSTMLDFGNIHPYTGGEQPSDAHLDDQFARAAKNSAGKPLVATEAGFHSALRDGRRDAQPGTSEEAAAIYVPRVFLENYRRGIARTLLYELLDEKPNPLGDDQEQHFGLFRTDFSPKPAAQSLRELLDWTADPGPIFQPGSLNYSVGGDTGDLRRVLLQKRDGTFLLVMWRQRSVWNQKLRLSELPAVGEVELTLGQPVAQARIVTVGAGAAGLQVVGGPASLRVGVGASPTVVILVPPSVSNGQLSGQAGVVAQSAPPILLVSGKRATFTRRGLLTFRTHCTSRNGESCKGVVHLAGSLRKKGSKRRKLTYLGYKDYLVPAGRSKTLRLRMGSKVRKGLRGRRYFRLFTSTVYDDKQGPAGSQRRVIKVRNLKR